jgi:crossover junction endodeoxyribonuclease RuvC
MRRVLGIDPGSQNTGYGVVEMAGSRLTHVAHGTIRSSSKDSLSARLARIYTELCAALAAHAPNEVSIESIFQARNAQSALKLGHARGVALLAVEQHGLPMVEYTPMQVKSAVVGYGRAEKHQVQEMVRRLLCLPDKAGPDASDALAVAICHLQSRSTLEGYAARGGARR